MDEDHTTTTLLLPLQLGIKVTASLCIRVAHCRQSKNFSNGPRRFQLGKKCFPNTFSMHCFKMTFSLFIFMLFGAEITIHTLLPLFSINVNVCEFKQIFCSVFSSFRYFTCCFSTLIDPIVFIRSSFIICIIPLVTTHKLVHHYKGCQ
jgi:hypothetical protein